MNKYPDPRTRHCEVCGKKIQGRKEVGSLTVTTHGGKVRGIIIPLPGGHHGFVHVRCRKRVGQWRAKQSLRITPATSAPSLLANYPRRIRTRTLALWFRTLWLERSRDTENILNALPENRIIWHEIYDKMRALGLADTGIVDARLWWNDFYKQRLRAWCNAQIEKEDQL